MAIAEPADDPVAHAPAPMTTSSTSKPVAAPRAIVVGASSGMGAALVRRLARDGYQVGALARRSELLDELAASCADAEGAVHTRAHDVLDTADVPALFEELVRELGGLDLFIYAAGVMPEVGKTEYDTEKDLQQVAVNLSGAMAWCNAAARLFTTQRSGTLIGIGSIAGDRGRKGNPAYHTTKAALATYLESLRNRLSEVGVHVLTVKPGFVETPMTADVPGMFWVISADQAAQTILGCARHKLWNTRYVPLRWWAVGAVIRAIPSFLFRRLNI